MCEFGGLTPLKEIPNSLSPLWNAAKKPCYTGVGVMVFITSWRATGLGVLTEWKNTCRSPAWSCARMGDSVSAASLAARPASSQPEAGEAAEAVSQLTPQRVAPEETSSAVVTKSNLLGTLHIYGPGIAMTEIRKLYESRNCKGLLCQCEVLK